jgi:MATE family, multidrug efflux pump
MISHRHILAIAVPIVISNVSTPLVGLVDTAVMGRLGDPAYIGAIALGAIILNFLFWGLGFLRMSTTALTAQAQGAGNDNEVRASLGRAMVIGLAAGGLMIVFQLPLNAIAFALVEATDKVEGLSSEYFNIRIWSAPAVLSNYVILGWFIGLGQSGKALVIQLFLNGVNLVLDFYFVIGLGFDVTGVGAASVIAEFSAFALGLWMVMRELRRHSGAFTLATLLEPTRIRRTMAINRDIMIRTLCLIFAFSWFTAQAAKSGDIILAANAILLNFITLSAFFLDGFAVAAETLVGQAMGANNRSAFKRVVRLSALWAFAISVIVSLVFWFAGDFVIGFLTINAEVRNSALTYLPWAAVAPVAAILAYQLDGVYNGVTRTAEMRNLMIVSLALYLAAWWILVPLYGNHGLWAALIFFFLIRGLTLVLRYPALVRATFS